MLLRMAPIIDHGISLGIYIATNVVLAGIAHPKKSGRKTALL